MLVGSYTVKFDSSGRIKVPEKFRTAIEEFFGREVFITCLTDEAIQIYPLPVWQKLTGITNQGLLHLKPDVRMFLLHVNRKGNRCEMDSKGRILISQDLRDKANLDGEVEVIGLDNHLEIWNKSRLDEKLDSNPLTSQDFERISELAEKDKGA